jgi:hypothetical protein
VPAERLRYLASRSYVSSRLPHHRLPPRGFEQRPKSTELRRPMPDACAAVPSAPIAAIVLLHRGASRQPGADRKRHRAGHVVRGDLIRDARFLRLVGEDARKHATRPRRWCSLIVTRPADAARADQSAACFPPPRPTISKRLSCRGAITAIV